MILFLRKPFREFITVLLTFLLLVSTSASGQVKFTASANESEIGRNDLVQVQFKIENARSVKSIDPPDFKNFDVVSGPNQETGSFSHNGNRSFYAAVSFILKPTKPGKYTIQPATAVVDGEKVRSNSVSIKVLDQNSVGSSASPLNRIPFSGFDRNAAPSREINNDYILRQDENVEEKIKNNLFLKLESNKTNCYVGEPVVVDFKLYTRLLSKTNVTDAPSFNGFSVAEMDVNQNATEEKIKGKKFNCYTLRKVQLFPTQAGNFTISPLYSENKISFLKNDRTLRQQSDPLSRMMDELGIQDLSSGDMVQETARLASNSLEIKVKPLPESDKPSDFSGAVGKFTIQSALQSERISTDDAGSLIVTISGSGNMTLITTPKINWPQGIDVYDSQVRENLDNQQIPVTGQKVFKIPFTVSRPGEYSIPPIHFNWFNPETNRYESSKTEPISFEVIQGKNATSTTASSGTPEERGGILSGKNLEKAGGILLGGGVLALLFFTFFRKKNKESDLETMVKLDDLKNEQPFVPSFSSDNKLQKAQENMEAGNPEAFYKSLGTEMAGYLSERLRIPRHELSKDLIFKKMDELHVGVGTVQLFESLRKDVDMARFAKSPNPAAMRNVYEKASGLIALLDKQINRPQ